VVEGPESRAVTGPVIDRNGFLETTLISRDRSVCDKRVSPFVAVIAR